MEKKELKPQCLIPVRPILIVGANVGGRANFFEVGGGGLVSTDPPMVAVPIRHPRYTLKGILENRTFSVNVPSVALVKEADYCGIVTGAKTDKVKDCHFKIFYGKLATAPMIEQCPINMECTVVNMLGTVTHMIIIGRVDGTYASPELVKDDKLDYSHFEQLLWFVEKAEYVTSGRTVGKSRIVGNEIKAVR